MRYRQKAGFTLIEVLVALVIVALSLTAVAASMSQMIDAANGMRDRTYASWIAQNKIAEMRLANVVPDVTSTTGELQFAGTDWSWEAVVSDLSELGIENLYRVDVTVSYPDSDSSIRTVTGFIGEPSVPGLSSRSWYIRAGRQNDAEPGPTR
ncbi:MAG: type II secretion system minor pseudopilin GspI [Woeseiaceae bacterium]|nr:type II secretion system minor pseudopilin GspI [Woeseiaceae bacterium]